MPSVIKFCSHSENRGHLVIKKRFGYPAKLRKKRIDLTLVNGRWINKHGIDMTEEVGLVS